MLIARFFVATVLAAITVLGTGGVFSQDYPNKPIRIVTTAPGGGADFTARLIAQGISGPMGQPVIVDNRGGTYVAEEVVLKTAADGYTLLVEASGLWIEPLFHKTPYDPIKDFSPITMSNRTPLLLIANPALAVSSVKDLIAYARAKPGVLNYAIQSVGGGNHLAAELFKSMAGVTMTSVPYKTTPQAIGDVINGQVQVMFANLSVALPQAKSGRLKALAVTSPQPSALAPDLPTVAASGLPGYEIAAIFSVFAPAKTPVAIVNRLNQEMVRQLRTQEFRERVLGSGSEVVAGSVEELAAYLKSDMTKWAKVIKEAGIKAE